MYGTAQHVKSVRCLFIPLRRCLSASVHRSTSSVSSQIQDGVQRVTLTSPKTRNALSLETMVAMRTELARGKEDDSVRCVVLRGEGPAFSAGHNLKVCTIPNGRGQENTFRLHMFIVVCNVVTCPSPICPYSL